jgi:hypothetical protein
MFYSRAAPGIHTALPSHHYDAAGKRDPALTATVKVARLLVPAGGVTTRIASTHLLPRIP